MVKILMVAIPVFIASTGCFGNDCTILDGRPCRLPQAQENSDDVGRPKEISPDQFHKLRATCLRAWPDNYALQELCEDNNIEAIRKMRNPNR